MNKAERLIGLATRAGKTTTGIELCEKAVKTGKAKLIVLASDASEETKKIFLNKGISIVYVSTKEQLGKCTGKEIRSVAVINDKEFSNVILKAYESNED